MSSKPKFSRAASGMPEPFKVEPWYSSEDAKRRLGPICKALNEQGGQTHLLGTSGRSLLVLADADDHMPPAPNEVPVVLEEAKADWSAIIDAALLYGTVFRMHNSKQTPRAVLFRHPSHRHPAVRYQRSTSADVEKVAKQIEALAKEVRKFGAVFKRAVTPWPKAEALAGTAECLTGIVDRLSQSADLIDRRFREAWRLSDGLPITRPH